MDAILLAAGLGTRLGPITQSTPKALVSVGGVPMLERIIPRLIACGVDRFVINTHHLADQVVRFVHDRGNFGVEVHFSHEPGAPLETGGALWKAAPLIRRDDPFFVHNTDILTDLPLSDLYDEHRKRAPLATLAVMERETSRYLLFDAVGLVGRVDEKKDLTIFAREAEGEVRKLAFAGIHVISPSFLDLLEESGAFSILDPYLRLVGEGHRILPYRADGYQWTDIGKPDQLAKADRYMEHSSPTNTRQIVDRTSVP